MNQRRLSPTDLQSVAFDHSAILPLTWTCTRQYSRENILPYIPSLSSRYLTENVVVSDLFQTALNSVRWRLMRCLWLCKKDTSLLKIITIGASYDRICAHDAGT